MAATLLVFAAVFAQGVPLPAPPAEGPPERIDLRPERVEVGARPGEARFEVVPYVPDAFQELHAPLPIPTDPLPDPDGKVVPPPACFYAVFNQPAHFPLPGFFPDGRMVATDAAVLYEGMTLAVYEGGRYELRFVVEAPKTVITLWLQLTLSKGDLPFGTITLPPLTILSPDTAYDLGADHELDVQRTSQPWLVRYTGYSHQLGRVHGVNPGQFLVSRSGTARFGNIPR